jgi:hypothetical protein
MAASVTEIGPRHFPARALARVAAELAQAALLAQYAAERQDYDCLDDAVTEVARLAGDVRDHYRAILVAGIRHT